MPQEIKIEVDDHSFTVRELDAILRTARHFPKDNVRVNDDPTNIKIYIGPYYKEKYRFWVDPKGDVGIVEKDLDVSGDEAFWCPSTFNEAIHELVTYRPQNPSNKQPNSKT